MVKWSSIKSGRQSETKKDILTLGERFYLSIENIRCLRYIVIILLFIDMEYFYLCQNEIM